MKAYDKPLIYTLSHIGTGIIAVFFPVWIWVFLAYQLLQLALDIRFFGAHFHIKRGNNFVHTARKIVEFALGYFITLLGLQSYKKLHKRSKEKIEF